MFNGFMHKTHLHMHAPNNGRKKVPKRYPSLQIMNGSLTNKVFI